jgi:hypothetical protein
VHLTLLQRIGVPIGQFGDSTGAVQEM